MQGSFSLSKYVESVVLKNGTFWNKIKEKVLGRAIMAEINISKNPLEINADRIRRNYLNPIKMDFMESYLYEEESRYRPDGPFQRDYARIMYSSSFRRLQGKMQLLGIKNDQFFRNRLTHSLEVAQISRSIANAIKYDAAESYIVEAGSLAHDIGNPPFGHSGERKLNELFKEVGGFEGNAQTLRILTNVEKKRPNFRGLNLTYRGMLSVVKYFNKFDLEAYEAGKKNQKFIYDDDYDMLKKAIEENEIPVRTLDVQIVDIADEIAYAAHDLEDGLRIKAFTCDELLHDYMAKYGESDCYYKFVDLVNKAKDKAGYGHNKIDSTQYSKLFRQELASSLINLFLNDIGLIPVDEEHAKITGTQHKEELGFISCGELVKGLKKLVFQCINHNDEVYRYEQSGNDVLAYLTEMYLDDNMYLPPEYRAKELMQQYEDLEGQDEDKLQKRLACDYIAGMMESYAIATYEKYSGRKFN